MKWLRAIPVGIALVLMFPLAALAQATPDPNVPMGNPGASVSGLPFSGSLHDLIMWATGIGFIVCLGVLLVGAGVLRPFGHLVGHKDTAIRGTTSIVASIVGAVLLGAGFLLVSFFWHVGQAVH